MMRPGIDIQSRTLIAILAVAFAAGCASTRMEQVDPADVATGIRKGDNIEITRSNGEFVPLKVVQVTATEVIAKDTRVPIDDIVAITKYVKGPVPEKILPNADSEAEYVWGLVGAIVIWALIL